MSGTKHTPGPWRAAIGDDFRPRYDEADFVVVQSDRFDAIDVWSKEGYAETYAEHEANARLIAAAPELLFALTNLLATIRGQGGTQYHAGEIADAAIAKAVGHD